METIKHSSVFTFSTSVDYAKDSIVSKIIMKKDTGNITLFAFDQGQELSEHTTPYDALIQVVEGEGNVIINREVYTVKTGESIIMPADIPHAVKADKQFKMVLTMIKG